MNVRQRAKDEPTIMMRQITNRYTAKYYKKHSRKFGIELFMMNLIACASFGGMGERNAWQ